MKKLVYLIIAITVLGLIVAGCIPVVPPAEQSNLGNLTRANTINVPGDYATIQAAIDAAEPGDTILVAVGVYHERLTVNKPVDIRGPQYGVDPTASGARTNPATEAIVDLVGLGVKNPNVLVEVPNGVSGVSISGFTLNSSWTCNYADESTIRCWNNDITVQDNVINGWLGVLYKGPGNNLNVSRNRMAVNKNGVVVQPNVASDATIANNVINPGGSLDYDSTAVYMTGTTNSSVTGNTAIDFVNGAGLSGSNHTNLTVSGNTFTGNKKGVSLWGISTFITITGNTLSNSLLNGIEIKGQDITITNNTITGNVKGIVVDKHTLATERVAIHNNNISVNTTVGLEVTSAVTMAVDATCNWWGDVSGPSGEGSGTGDTVSSNVDFNPWLLSPAPDAVCLDYYWYGFDQIVECVVNAKNHGQFVSCVSHLTKDWLKGGLITAEDKAAITKWAAKSDIGKK